ncbi:MAG: hypothetical protein V1740_02320, partial [Candidatus Woesearchaeota archaeon]
MVNSIGIFLICYGLFAIIYYIFKGQPSWIFWFCYLAMILIGIGALKKDGVLIASQLNLLIFPLIFWIIDFIFQFLAKKPLWGITDYFFENIYFGARIISLEHFFLVPLGLIVLYFIRLKRNNSWMISIVQVFSVYLFM